MPYVPNATLNLLLTASNNAGATINTLNTQVLGLATTATRLQTSLNSANNQLSRMQSYEQGIRQLRTGFSELRSSSLALEATGAAILAPGIAAVKTAADFQTSMLKIANLTDIPKDKIKEVHDGILALAKVIPVSPNDLGEAAYQAFSRNLTDVAAGLAITKVSAEDQAIGLGKAATVAGLLSTVIKIYGGNAEDVAKINDQLFQGVKSGAGEVENFAGSLGKTIGVAKDLNVSFPELIANVATLTNSGLSAEESTTALRQVMVELLKVTPQQSKELDKLHESATGLRQEIKDKGLYEVLNRLFEKTKEGTITVKDNADAIGKANIALKQQSNDIPLLSQRITIAQQQQTVAAQKLTDAQIKLQAITTYDAKGNAARTKALAAVTAATISKERADLSLATAQQALVDGNLQVESAQNKVAAANAKSTVTSEDQLEILAKIFPNLRGYVGVLNTVGTQQKSYEEILGRVNNAEGQQSAALKEASDTFNFQFSLAVNKAKVAFILFGDTVLPVLTSILGYIGQFIDLIAKVPKPVKEALVVLSLVIGPLLIIGGAVAFLVGSFGLLVLAIMSIGPVLAASGIGFAAAGTAFLITAGTILVVVAAIAALTLAAYFLITRWDEVKAKTIEVWGFIPTPIQKVLTFLSTIAVAQFNAFVTALKAAMQGFIDIVTIQWEIIKTFIKILKDIWHGDWTALWEDVKHLAKLHLDLIVAIIKAPFVPLIEGIKALFSGLPDSLRKIGTDMANALIAGFKSIPGIGTIIDAASKVGNAIGSGLHAVGLATGGPARGGQPYIVGENGPELFVPGNSGTVVPNSAMGGMTIHNVTVVANDPVDFMRQLQEYQDRQLRLARRAS